VAVVTPILFWVRRARRGGKYYNNPKIKGGEEKRKKEKVVFLSPDLPYSIWGRKGFGIRVKRGGAGGGGGFGKGQVRGGLEKKKEIEGNKLTSTEYKQTLSGSNVGWRGDQKGGGGENVYLMCGIEVAGKEVVIRYLLEIKFALFNLNGLTLYWRT